MINKKLRKEQNKNFETAKKFIKNWFDLDLTLIELAELREISNHTTNIDIIDKKRYGKKYNKWTINPPLEAMYIFMNKNYKTQIQDYGDLHRLDYRRSLEKRLSGYDILDDFKKMQEEMHLPQ